MWGRKAKRIKELENKVSELEAQLRKPRARQQTPTAVGTMVEGRKVIAEASDESGFVVGLILGAGMADDITTDEPCGGEE